MRYVFAIAAIAFGWYWMTATNGRIRELEAAPKPEPKDLVVKSIKVVDDEGKTVINIVGLKRGGGIWVQDPCDSGRNVAMYCIPGQGPTLSLMDGATQPSRFAVAVTDKEAYFQVVGKDDKVYIRDAKDVIKK